MCGIAFLYHAHGSPPKLANIERMNRALNHRGPDANSHVIRGMCALGHTRLSIVDLQTGDQPLYTSDNELAIVFNGEIYNYRALRRELEGQGVGFTTSSDTEVILQLYRQYGEKCLTRLRGMFAFAIHHRSSGELFVARDRLGIKPLFFTWDGRVMAAASEMKALFASGYVEPALNPESIRNYFIFQHSIAPHTPFLGIEELPPGHAMRLAPGCSPRIWQYWDLEFPREGEYESTDEAYWTTQFTDLLGDAAASHTIGDVPIGAYLSGGIDSSAMAWLLTQTYPQRLRTFSIHFLNRDMDESPMYRATAKHLGVENTELVMDDTRLAGFLPELEQCLYHLEQPQRLAVDIPHFQLSDLVRRNGYKVVYTGDGADEIFGGYDCYRQDYMRTWGNAMTDVRRRRAQYFQEYTKYFAKAHIQMLWRLHRPRNQRRVIRQYGCYPAWYDFWRITDRLLPGLFAPQFEQAAASDGQAVQAADAMRPQLAGRHALNQSLYIETKTRLPGWILWKSDRLSMAHGVEARVPFMDHQLVELAARMPPALKLNGMDEKYILRKVVTPHLPAHPTYYKKRAFYTPIREWFFTVERQAEVAHYLSRDALREVGIFEPGRVISMLSQLGACGRPQDTDTQYRVMRLEWILMAVLSVQILHRQFVGKEAACFARP